MEILEYRLNEAERKIRGLQGEVSKLNTKAIRMEQKQRDLEIKQMVNSGTTQKATAKIFDLSASRIHQIVKNVS